MLSNGNCPLYSQKVRVLELPSDGPHASCKSLFFFSQRELLKRMKVHANMKYSSICSLTRMLSLRSWQPTLPPWR